MKPFPGKRRDVRLYTNLEPCMMCLGASLVSDVSEVYFALESPTDGAAKLYKQWNLNPTDHVGCREIKITGGILQEESRDLFRKFCERFSLWRLFNLGENPYLVFSNGLDSQFRLFTIFRFKFI